MTAASRHAAEPAPFTLAPAVAHTLRSGCCTRGTVLLVEQIEATFTLDARKRRRWVTRLLLGDGDLSSKLSCRRLSDVWWTRGRL